MTVSCGQVKNVALGPLAQGPPEGPTYTQLQEITTCGAARKITDLFQGLAPKQFEKENFFFALHFSLLFFWPFLLQWWNDDWILFLNFKFLSIKYELWAYATRHHNHEYRIRFLNFVLHMRAGRSEIEKCQVVILKQRFKIRCHAAFRRQGGRGTHSRRDRHLKRELGSSSHTQKKQQQHWRSVCVGRRWRSPATVASPKRANHHLK